VITDSDGSTAPGTLTITFNDDAPTASNEASQNVAEGATVTGMLDFVQGADGASVTAINGTTLVFGGDGYSQVIDIGVGTIKVKADGTYSFTADASVDNTNGPVAVNATYTVTDGDGDTATANIAFAVTDANHPTGGTAAAAVDDDGLTGGNPASTTGDINANAGDNPADTSEATFTGVLGGSVGGDTPGTFSFAALNNTTGTVGQEMVTYSWNAGTNTLTATVTGGARDGTSLFTVEVTDPATGAYHVTLLDNVLQAQGPNNENDATVNLGYVITDSDGSTAPGTLTITFNDDAPTMGAIQNAIMPSVNNTDAHGTWQPVFGADGPSATGAIGIAMGTASSGETYTITDTGTHTAAGDEIFSVKVTSGSSSYTFYEYTHYDSGSLSAEMFGYASLADAQAGLGANEFFTLTMSANGGYDFHLVSNSLQTFQPFDFTALQPGNGAYATITNGTFSFQSGNDNIAGRSILMDGFTAANTDPNSANNKVFINNGAGGGLGVNNGNLDTGETIRFEFNNIAGDSAYVGLQSSVTIGIGKGNNAANESFLITIWNSNHTVSHSEIITQPDGTPIIIDAAHWNGLTAADTFFAFEQVDIKNLGGSAGYTTSDDKVLITSISGASVVGSTTLTFTPTITDQDGDTAQASSDLSISLVGTTNNSNGYAETGTDTTAEVVVASANADVLSGGSGSGDTVDYSNSTAGVSVNLATNTVSSGWATGDTISGFENAVGSSFADTLTATNTGSTLDGGANSTGGTDVLNGGSGNDILIASRAGTDSLTGNGGSDTFVLHAAGGANVTINDFNLLANDQLIVDIGQGLTFTTAAALDASNFHTGDETNVATWNGGTGKEFTYNSATGELWYSANGTGSDKIDLAHLSTGLPMTAANIHTV
jgi:hypothetical protein